MSCLNFDLDWTNDFIMEIDKDLLDLERELTIHEKRNKMKKLTRKRASLGEQLLVLFTLIPIHVAGWNESEDKFIIYDWTLFVQHVTNYGDPVADFSGSSQKIIGTFRTAGIILECDINPEIPESEELIHKISHPLLKRGRYDQAAFLSYYGPVAYVNKEEKEIKREVIQDLFPELDNLGNMQFFQPL